MNGDFATLPGLPSWQPPGNLSGLGRPTHEILTDFIHQCSPDPDTRTVAITSLVLGFWQLKGRALTPDVPSLLLVHTGEATDDPIDEFTRGLVYDKEENKPRVQTEGPFTYAPIGLAPKAMRNAMLERHSLGADHGDNPSRLQKARDLEKRFHAAQITGYGHGHCRPYSEAWHAEYGWLTDRDEQVILRLNEPIDRAAFRKDLLDDPCKLFFPSGIGSDLSMGPKGISLSGSLPGELCDSALATNVYALGIPFFLLPHTTEEPLTGGGLAAVEYLAKIWQHEPAVPVRTSLRLPITASVQAHEAALRRRLANLPATYEFAVQQAVHQLDSVCDRIACFAGGNQAGMEQLVGIYQDLYDHTLRGMVISVAGLSYFGRGLYLGPECEPLRAKAIKLLSYLRENGPTTGSVLLKNLHLKKRDRDVLLDCLGEECLVKVEGGKATATDYREFTSGLYAREEFSIAKDRSAE